MIAYAGLRAARLARDLYAKLLAAGITSVIVIQATVNFFAVLGVMPLTGVPLPFISYGNSNLVVLLAGMGILAHIAQNGAAKPKLRVVGGSKAAGRSSAADITGRGEQAKDSDRGRRDRRARGAGARGRRRAAG
jgi:cell division protein FtsW